MPDSNRPSGPGKPIAKRREAAKEREQIEEANADLFGDEAAAAADSTRGPRTAECDSTIKDKERDSASGTSGAGRG